MEQMYQDYKDIAEFYIVYISEAHAADDRSPVGYAKELGINEHKTYGERCEVATRLQREKKLTIPCLIDNMDNAVSQNYSGWPDRVFLVRKDGTLAVAGQRGPWGFKPGMEAAADWLAEYRESGREPDVVVWDDTPDYGELQREFMMAFRRSDYDKAIELGETALKAFPSDRGMMYNIACAHCLKGANEHAYRWLEWAIEAGYRDADHLLADDDFKPIRDEERFQNLVRRVRERASSAESAGVDRTMVESILGDWDMETKRRGHSMSATMSLSFEGGTLVGMWASRGREMPLIDVKYVDNKLTFKRRMRGDMELAFEGTIEGNRISGKYTGAFGEMESGGTRKNPS